MQYTRNMRGIDTTNQIQTVYFNFIQSHNLALPLLLHARYHNQEHVHYSQSSEFFISPQTSFSHDFPIRVGNSLGVKVGMTKAWLLSICTDLSIST
jgi:hypothetical protein